MLTKAVTAIFVAVGLAPVGVEAVGVPKLHRGTLYDLLQTSDAHQFDESGFIQRAGQQYKQGPFRLEPRRGYHAEIDEKPAEFFNYLLENASSLVAKAKRQELEQGLPYQKKTFRARM